MSDSEDDVVSVHTHRCSMQTCSLDHSNSFSMHLLCARSDTNLAIMTHIPLKDAFSCILVCDGFTVGGASPHSWGLHKMVR